ncbi:hypothetical protein [Streptomyces candidus]|uniref:Acyl-CoA reductase-like NAD-dependent aldehyde dehydrogenase n=1 Tax=Streptomyces candidus TaxID=67283 RepID=A0A7X0HGP2_9ACTN|nr:hypothetical protein [Streptomyces candidus]MBB6437201.1 acyl-CoA reductase-like NAD-dependent aldehyde dehydrogenase [Streptomyces candidus]GHH38191.1 hypothetical protein GCM10018773_15770 [Streptomyces candidus]
MTMQTQETTEAGRTLAALEERVRSGDEAVTADQVEQARGLSRFARLRKDAADRKAEQARTAAATRARAEAIDRAEQLLDAHTLDDIAAQYVAARKALESLVAACEARTAAVDEAARMLSIAAVRDAPGRPDVTARWDGSPANSRVETGTVRHVALEPGPVLHCLVRRIADAHPRGLPLDHTYSLARQLVVGPQSSPLDDAIGRLDAAS